MSVDHATAIAQAADAIEQGAVLIKRRMGSDRKLLQQLRQAQATLADAGLIPAEAKVRALGIEVQTQPQKEGIVNGDSHQEAAVR